MSAIFIGNSTVHNISYNSPVRRRKFTAEDRAKASGEQPGALGVVLPLSPQGLARGSSCDCRATERPTPARPFPASGSEWSQVSSISPGPSEQWIATAPPGLGRADKKQRSALRSRKLLTEVPLKARWVRKGSVFSTSVSKQDVELGPEMTSSGSERDRPLSPTTPPPPVSSTKADSCWSCSRPAPSSS